MGQGETSWKTWKNRRLWYGGGIKKPPKFVVKDKLLAGIKKRAAVKWVTQCRCEDPAGKGRNHRVALIGNSLVLLDHPTAKDEMTLMALAGLHPATCRCFQLLQLWQTYTLTDEAYAAFKLIGRNDLGPAARAYYKDDLGDELTALREACRSPSVTHADRDGNRKRHLRHRSGPGERDKLKNDPVYISGVGSPYPSAWTFPESTSARFELRWTTAYIRNEIGNALRLLQAGRPQPDRERQNDPLLRLQNYPVVRHGEDTYHRLRWKFEDTGRGNPHDGTYVKVDTVNWYLRVFRTGIWYSGLSAAVPIMPVWAVMMTPGQAVVVGLTADIFGHTKPVYYEYEVGQAYLATMGSHYRWRLTPLPSSPFVGFHCRDDACTGVVDGVLDNPDRGATLRLPAHLVPSLKERKFDEFQAFVRGLA
jgi:hypothetical protein